MLRLFTFFFVAILAASSVIATPMPPLVKRANDWPNVHLDLRTLPATSLDQPITHGVIVQVAKPATNSHGTTLNHWRIFFALAEDKSISFDMVKQGATNPVGVVGVLGREYAVSNNGVQIFPMMPKQGLTVRQILDALNTKGYLRFKYADAGEGCRSWVSHVLQFMKSQDMVTDQNGLYTRFEQSVQCVFDEQGQSTHRAITHGTFY